MPDTDTLQIIQGRSVLVCAPDGATIASERQALDLIGEALSQGTSFIYIPVARLAEDFFHLSTGLAGQILQKCINYRQQLVVAGDISTYLAESRSWHDFVYEANRGSQIWFVSDQAEFERRLQAAGGNL